MVSAVWRLTRLIDGRGRQHVDVDHAQQRHGAAVRGPHGEGRDVLDAVVLRAGEPHPHRHFGLAAAEIAQRRATQGQPDEARDILGAEAERRRTLAIDAHGQLAVLVAGVDADIAQLLAAGQDRHDVVASSLSVWVESPTSCTCTFCPGPAAVAVVAERQGGASRLRQRLADRVAQRLGDDGVLAVEGDERDRIALLAVVRIQLDRCGTACGWRRGTSRPATARPTSAPWCSCPSIRSRCRPARRRRRRTCSSWSASSARCSRR